MCKKLIYLMLCVLVLGVTGSASAELIAYWPFDESTGATLHDVVGGNNGTLQGNPTWIVGPINGALDFDGNEDLVTIPNSSALQLRSTGQYTVAVWVNVVNPDGGLILFSGQGCVAWANWYLGVTEGEPDARNLGGPPKQEGSLVFGVRTVNWGTVAGYVAAPFVAETWMHVAATYDGVTLRIYIDGQEVDSDEEVPLPRENTNMPLNIAGDNGCSSIGRNFFTGKIDDLRIYDEALSQADIQDIMTPASAWKPNPADNGSVAGIDPILSWNPGKQAVTHNVYLGTTMEDVSAATTDNHPNVEVSLGQSENTYSPADSLVYGQTYYWRVDEVNGVTVWPGDVWSFLVQPLKAYYPSPVDGLSYLDPDIVLSWNPGLGAESHDVYLGTDPNNLTLKSTAQTTTTYEPETLNYDTTYYWRINEFDGLDTHVGDVWSFSILPDIPIRNPNLVCWWMLDEGLGTRAVDWSGYNRHGTIYGGPIWVDGYDGGALEFDGINNYVDLPIDSLIPSLTSCTITTWVDFSNTGGPWQRIFGFYNPNGFTSYMTLTPRSGDSGPMTFAIVTDFASPYPGNETDQLIAPSTLASGWHHVAVVIDGDNDPNSMQLYLDGTVVAEDITETLPADLNDVTSNMLGHPVHGLEAYFTGLLDDFRIYDVALTQEEIKTVMRIDPLRAWNQKPAVGRVMDLIDAETELPISWSPGDDALHHNVYFGTDYAAVDAADASDITGIYRGQQDANNYTPPEDFERGQTYYWRIDEINPDATISKGKIWSFTIADYLIVDDFEGYNNNSPDRVFQTWVDGVGYSADQYLPENPGNDTGSAVGHDIWSTDSPYYQGNIIETLIVHVSGQSMPMDYNNVNDPYVSEAIRTWDTPQDWTAEGVAALTIWFRGYRQSVGGISYNAATQTYAMTGAGSDIYDLSDSFHYAYKQLSGEGSITAKVESLTDVHEWSKAGVMIRETLDADSAQVLVSVTPEQQGVEFMYRPLAGETTTAWTEAGDPVHNPPHWVRIRRVQNDFYAEHSVDGNIWVDIEGDNPSMANIPMSANTYIGLHVLSHEEFQTAEAVFSNVSITGTVTPTGPFTQSQDIGILSNDADRLYVIVEDDDDNSHLVEYPEPNTTQIYEWQDFNIDMREFSNAGVNTAAIAKMTLGVGNKAAPASAGTGSMYFDDIRLHWPRCVPSQLQPVGDLNDDCVVDESDLEIMANEWLDTATEDVTLVADLDDDGDVDFGDYARLASSWLEEQLWPEL